jgi:uncharacterized protein YuzE
MKVTYDASVDAFSFRLAPGARVARTVEWGPGVHVDLDGDGRLLGVEVLEASAQFDRDSLASLRRPSNELTLEQAAKVSGLAESTLRVQLNKGRLKGEKRGRDWIVQRSALVSYLESRAPSGRPAVKHKARRRRPMAGTIGSAAEKRKPKKR